MFGKIAGLLKGGGQNLAMGAGAIENSVRDMISLSKSAPGAKAGFNAVRDALHTPTTESARYLKGMFSGGVTGAGIGAIAGAAKGGYDYYNGSGTLGGIVSNAAMYGAMGGLAGGAYRALKPAGGGGWIRSNQAFNGITGSNSTVMKGYNRLPTWMKP